MSIHFVMQEVVRACTLLATGSIYFSTKLALVTLSLRFLMAKGEVNTAGSCCLLIKHMGRSSRANSQGATWDGPTESLLTCNVPVLRYEGHEADDVLAMLAEQALRKGHKVVVASPDKDFKQLLSEGVQIVMPLVELNRWSFCTLKHYEVQYNCDSQSDLSLRCILGDEADPVPGIQHVAPGFGRKTALKLLKKHGSLEELLGMAAVRTMGKRYAQDAVVEHAEFLRRNYQVLALRRDVNVELQEEWLVEIFENNWGEESIIQNFQSRIGL